MVEYTKHTHLTARHKKQQSTHVMLAKV